MRITEFAKRIGKSSKTLRRWHESGKLVPAVITPYGQRIYTESQVEEYLKTACK